MGVWESGALFPEEVCQHCQMLLKDKKKGAQEKAVGFVDEE